MPYSALPREPSALDCVADPGSQLSGTCYFVTSWKTDWQVIFGQPCRTWLRLGSRGRINLGPLLHRTHLLLIFPFPESCVNSYSIPFNSEFGYFPIWMGPTRTIMENKHREGGHVLNCFWVEGSTLPSMCLSVLWLMCLSHICVSTNVLHVEDIKHGVTFLHLSTHATCSEVLGICVAWNTCKPEKGNAAPGTPLNSYPRLQQSMAENSVDVFFFLTRLQVLLKGFGSEKQSMTCQDVLKN